MADKHKASLERKLLLAGGILGAAVALLTGINALFEEVKKGIGIFARLGDWQLVAIAVAFLLFALWLWHLSLRRRSRLLLPDALRLQRDNPNHVIGREDDIEKLVRKCRQQRLVFLVGESGVGKSALLKAKLLPQLEHDKDLLPIYVESLVGQDWESEPRRYLAKALENALSEIGQNALNEIGRETQLPDLVRLIKQKFKRTPLVILDQFDDYQTRHRDRFLNGGVWLEHAQLVDQNGFWRDLRNFVADGDIYLLIATRSDSADGLTSVRLHASQTFPLTRLSTSCVGPLLDLLTAPRGDALVIADPEADWTRLADRLVRDLEQGGVVLPQQLKIVLAGLGTLPQRFLTVGAYEGAGGLPGLEARFIEDGVARVAQQFKVPEAGLRKALLKLVGQEGGRPRQVLIDLIDPGAPENAAAALAALEKEEILRSRDDAGTSWLLDHDYLARAVIEADRRANRWQRTLEEGAKALGVAGASISAPKTWVRWWRALLPAGTQLAFFRDRLFGRFRYGGYRPYALKSLWRFGPYVVILPLSVGLVLQYAVWVEDRPWGTLTNIATGKRNDLTKDAAVIGRPASSVQHFTRQVELFAPHVSRIHLLLTRDLQALDLRSSYGTTLNGKFLNYSGVQQLKGEDILVLAGEGAFQFSRRAYWPWQFLTGPSDHVELARQTGWGLLIDGRRGRITPLRKLEEFLVLGADGSITTSKRSNQAIAVVRFRDLRAMELKGVPVKFTLVPTEVPYGPPRQDGQFDQAAVAQCALTVGAASLRKVSLEAHQESSPVSATDLPHDDSVSRATKYLSKLENEWLSLEILDSDAEVTATLKMTDYDYGALRLVQGREMFGLTAMGDRNMTYLTQWLFHYKNTDFQLILRNPAFEKAPSKPRAEVREELRPLSPCLIPASGVNRPLAAVQHGAG